MQLTNNSPLGDLNIPGVGRVAAGATFTVPDDVAESFVAQGFEPVGGDAATQPSEAAVSTEAEQVTVQEDAQ